jgi:sulfur relay protein TusB/DsrH
MNGSTAPQLHIIQQTISLQSFEKQSARLVKSNDNLLFLNDGLYALFEAGILHFLNLKNFKQTQLLVIDEQLVARGLQNNAITNGVSPINYSDFVGHAQEASKVISW